MIKYCVLFDNLDIRFRIYCYTYKDAKKCFFDLVNKNFENDLVMIYLLDDHDHIIAYFRKGTLEV